MDATTYDEQPTTAVQAAFPVIAIGASAGGLAALEDLFGRTPEQPGAAYVVLQHLSPEFKSHMTELLGRVTRLPVTQATDNTVLEPNHVYVIPPKKEMILVGDKVLLTDKDPRNAPSLPIDTFLRSMAQEAGPRSIAVILSGTGSDGARGVREVKAAGGKVIVQHPDDAEFDGMPENALAAGIADAVLPAAEIPAEISRLLPALSLDTPPAMERLPLIDVDMQKILDTLAKHHDVDFSCYKPTTLTRRIRRRMELANATDAARYAMLIASDAQESKRLHHDLLIGVTEFFRDAEAFDDLAEAACKSLFADKTAAEVRVWIAGCATGEEVYSIAIVLDEARAASKSTARIKLFATDIHQEALKQASAGVYPAEALAGLSPARRSRYFCDEGAQVRVADSLREMVVFATHNLITDAPFTQLDMICCRNVLIYFQAAIQARVLALFHFGLRTGGLLFLGPSETLGKLEEEFDPISTKSKIYSKHRDLRLAAHAGFARLEAGIRRREMRPISTRNGSVPEAYEALLARYMPPAFLLDESFKLLHCFGGGEKFLSFKGGRLSTSMSSLLEGRIKTAVSGLIERFKEDPNSAHAVNLRQETSEGTEGDYRITIVPIALNRSSQKHVLIEIRPLSEPAANDGLAAAGDSEVVASEYVESLEHDLELARGQLQSTVEELEAANEELQAANEELVASNEELQSTNEELRSVNEELNTVNVDHQNKIAELTEVTEDLEKLLHTINVGVLFLDPDMCIRRANQRIAELLHILPRDVGRSFDHFKNNLEAPGVYETALAVLDGGEAAEQEIRTSTGRVLLVNVLPYSDQPIKRGVVVTIVDITSLKAAESEAERLSALVRDARDAIVSETLDGTILSWNTGAARLYGYTEEEAVGQHIGLIVPEDRMAEIISVFKEVERGKDVPPFETVRVAKSGARLDVLMSVAPIRSETGSVSGISTISLDITARRQAEERAQIAVEQRDKFLALLSHELRNPLMALLSANELLMRSDGNSETAHKAQQLISRQITQMSRLLEDTLDASRMRHDKIELHRRLIDLRGVLEAVADGAKGRAEEEGIRLETSLPEAPVQVRADATRLQQAVVNLVQNAINHSAAGQAVSVSLSVDDDGAVVRVTDDGTGISPEAMPKLFEPFFQASRRSRHGMGLGLSLARSVVRAHGGEITVSSAGPGRGASFQIRLPLAQEAESGADLPAAKGESADKATILLVDDDDASRESLGVLLRSAGYNVLEAGNGTEGLRLIAEANPSVAVIDVGLPDISGLEVARRVRSSSSGQQIRLIALTGFGRQADREAAIEAGCDMHLVKPIDFTTLERVIAYQAAR